jgi:hypothetical protein
MTKFSQKRFSPNLAKISTHKREFAIKYLFLYILKIVKFSTQKLNNLTIAYKVNCLNEFNLIFFLMNHCQRNPKKDLAIIVDMPVKSCNKKLLTKCPKTKTCIKN